MIVCVCRRISDRDIARHVRAGMDFDDLQFELGVASQCGQCEGCARELVAQCSVTHPVAALHQEGTAVHTPAAGQPMPVTLSARIAQNPAWGTGRQAATV